MRLCESRKYGRGPWVADPKGGKTEEPEERRWEKAHPPVNVILSTYRDRRLPSRILRVRVCQIVIV